MFSLLIATVIPAYRSGRLQRVVLFILTLMYDQNGRYIGKGTIKLSQYEVDASLLQSGLYFIKIGNDRGAVIKKVMKN